MTKCDIKVKYKKCSKTKVGNSRQYGNSPIHHFKPSFYKYSQFERGKDLSIFNRHHPPLINRHETKALKFEKQEYIES